MKTKVKGFQLTQGASDAVRSVLSPYPPGAITSDVLRDTALRLLMKLDPSESEFPPKIPQRHELTHMFGGPCSRQECSFDLVRPEPDIGIAVFALALLADLSAWGAQVVWGEKAQLSVIPAPEYDGDGARDKLQEAMQRLRDENGTPEVWNSGVSAAEARLLAQEGEFSLRRVGDPFVSIHGQVDVGEVFNAGVRTWSMPYRSREGRSARFVGFFAHDSVAGGRPIPCGLIEIGDDTPVNRFRDQALGFDLTQTDDPSSSGDSVFLPGGIQLSELSARAITLLRALMRPSRGSEALAVALGDTPHAAEIMQLVLRETQEDVPTPKTNLGQMELDIMPTELASEDYDAQHLRRFVRYGNSLSAGHLAVNRVIDDGICSPLDQKTISQLLRAIGHLTTPRVSLEAVICGALPPFGELRVGKLMAAMMAHPEARSVISPGVGLILSEVFDPVALAAQLPQHGALFLTTKGLYPGHSVQYNRVWLGGSPGIPLRKLGDTEGSTTSHIGNLAMATAEALIGNRISRLYGSGSGKRQRFLFSAARLIGLQPAEIEARVRRPVYGSALISNLERVAVLNEKPLWLSGVHALSETPSERKGSSDGYEAVALAQWRSRWLPKGN